MYMPVVATAVAAIPAVIIACEQSAPGEATGADKLESARLMLEAVYVISGGAPEAFARVWPILSGAIAGLVALYNRLGWPKPAAPAP